MLDVLIKKNDVDNNYDLPSGEIILLSDWIVGSFKGFVNLDNFEFISMSDDYNYEKIAC